MWANAKGRPLAVVVPAHNEERRLPRLIASLRAQTVTDVPVVFVDNGSTDASAALLRGCPEVAGGRWQCIEEPRVGKANAMAAATAYCIAALGARYLCFLDADAHCQDDRWLETSARAAADSGGALGYVYSPVTYRRLEGLPVLAAANRACEAVLHGVIRQGFAFAHAGAATFSADLLRRFLRDAARVTEQGLRLSLLALSEGSRGQCNPGVVESSSRRIVVNARNLRRWCFYDRDFYRHKDINATVKLDLEAPAPVPDLDPAEVGRFFERQALKIAARNVVAPALFDASGTVASRVEAVFGADLRPLRAAARAELDARCILGDGLDDLLVRVAALPPTIALARDLETLMRRQHDGAAALSPPRTPGAGDDPRPGSRARG